MIHLDKALARIREYERMKLKAELNPCNASSAGVGDSEVSHAEQASALSADPLEGTQSKTTKTPHVHTLFKIICFCAEFEV